MLRDSVVGIASTIEYMSPASQLVLSLKHSSKTSVVQYKIPHPLDSMLTIRNNDIFISPEINAASLKVGVNFRDIPHIGDLVVSNEDTTIDVATISEQYFSTINHMTVVRASDDTLITGEVPLAAGGIVPYFSVEMLNYIKENPRLVTIGDVIWISLKRFDHTNEPFLRYTIESNSMIKFNQMLGRFVSPAIRNYRSLPDILRNFSEMIYKEVSMQTNLLHLEVVLKSYLITNENDYRIPMVTDIHDVRFNDIFSIIARRSLGAQFALERLPAFLERPETYNSPHQNGVFDVFFQLD